MVKGLIFYRFQNKNIGEIRESFINNIRGDRLIFDTHEPIDPGINLECEIYRQTNPQKNIIVPISILAKVVWVKKIDSCSKSGNEKYRTGLKIYKKLDRMPNLV